MFGNKLFKEHKSAKVNYAMRLFADDTSAYISIKYTNDHQYLQQDLNNLQYWKQNGKIAFHPDKCSVLFVTGNKKILSKLFTPYIVIHWSHYEKDRQDLKWKNHVNNVCTNANKMLGFTRRHLNISSTSVMGQAYISLERTSYKLLDLCSVLLNIFDNKMCLNQYISS